MVKERLDKVLSSLGFGTRIDVKRDIHRGFVEVNGVIVKDHSFKVSLQDKIKFDDEFIPRKEQYYFMMNKAPDCITATEDFKEKTVMDYLRGRHRGMDLFPVGRLDRETVGLLLITTDGKFAHHYTSPKHLVEKEYYAEVTGTLSEADTIAFANGIELEDGYKTLPAKLEILTSGEISKAKVFLKEGKYRQIRRMFTMLGKEVTFLKREKMGTIRLDETLPLGGYRELTEEEESTLR
ncbi:MAG: rRNA pseudouridine synthase [Leptospiraceae bacterium]|nr:rRNA pseudouridine synthase [Leptospiraceae bacterium]